MSKNRLPIPKELKEFNSLFFDFEYRHDLNRLFDDFLTIVICCFGFGTNEELYLQTIKPYNREELDRIARLLAEILNIYDKANKLEIWVDPLGDYYEYLVGNYKRSRLGQYFTPKELCDMMAQMIIDKDSFGKKVLEPASGSGRMVLAANAVTKGNYFVCVDKDPICAKMTAINLAMHGIKCEVHCSDYLRDEPPYFSYFINYEFWKVQTPHILQKSPA